MKVPPVSLPCRLRFRVCHFWKSFLLHDHHLGMCCGLWMKEDAEVAERQTQVVAEGRTLEEMLTPFWPWVIEGWLYMLCMQKP